MTLTQVLRRSPKEPPEPPSTAHLERPRLNTGVRLHSPVAEGEPWVVQRGEHQYFRIGADLATLVGALDGTGDVYEIAERLGRPWTAEAVGKAVLTLDKAQLLAKTKAPPGRHRKIRRVKYIPPINVQFAVLRSGDAAARRIIRLRLASPRTLGLLVALLAVVGAFMLVGQGSHVASVLGSPISMKSMLAVLTGLFVTTIAHEFGHACLLAHYGGRPGRMGVMLFYFAPAMFCDVSDSWRLNHLQRAKVSLAGIGVQVGVSSASACAAGIAGPGPTGDTLMLFALVNAVAAVVNLVPFVKLDGYIALMSYLNRPNLRDSALTSLRMGFVALLTGKPYRINGPRWLPWFGVGCVITPLAMVVRGLGQWLDTLMSLGTFGTLLSSCLFGTLAFALLKLVAGLVKSFRGNRPRPLRLAAFVLVVAALAVGSTQVRVPVSQVASYEVDAEGKAYVRVPSGAELQPVREGDRVELQQAGLVLRKTLNTASVDSDNGTETPVPLSGLVPINAENVRLPGKSFPIRLDAPMEPGSGSARLHSQSLSLPRWAYERLVLPFAAPFL